MDEKGNLHKTVLNTLLLNPFCIRIILTNLSILYLSIDFPDRREEWERITKELNGYHLLASDELQKEIKTKVFDNNSFLIPRYLLLDVDGNIINGDMPRPSQLEQLLSTLLKCIGG